LRYRWEFNIIKADLTDRVMTALAEHRVCGDEVAGFINGN
jgi:hypothetical protein